MKVVNTVNTEQTIQNFKMPFTDSLNLVTITPPMSCPDTPARMAKTPKTQTMQATFD